MAKIQQNINISLLWMWLGILLCFCFKLSFYSFYSQLHQIQMNSYNQQSIDQPIPSYPLPNNLSYINQYEQALNISSLNKNKNIRRFSNFNKITVQSQAATNDYSRPYSKQINTYQTQDIRETPLSTPLIRKYSSNQTLINRLVDTHRKNSQKYRNSFKNNGFIHSFKNEFQNSPLEQIQDLNTKKLKQHIQYLQQKTENLQRNNEKLISIAVKNNIIDRQYFQLSDKYQQLLDHQRKNASNSSKKRFSTNIENNNRSSQKIKMKKLSCKQPKNIYLVKDKQNSQQFQNSENSISLNKSNNSQMSESQKSVKLMNLLNKKEQQVRLSKKVSNDLLKRISKLQQNRKIKDKQSDMIQQFKNKIQSYVNQKLILIKQIQKYQQQIKKQKQKNKKYEQQLDLLQEKYKKLQLQKEQIKKEIDLYKIKYTESLQNINNNQKQKMFIQTKNLNYQSQKTKLQQKNIQYQAKIQQIKKQTDLYKSRLSIMQAKFSELINQNRLLAQKHQIIQRQKHNQQINNQKLIQQIKKIYQKIQIYQNTCKKLSLDNNNYKNKIQQFKILKSSWDSIERRARHCIQIDNAIDHLWKIKQTQFHNIHQILSNCKQNETKQQSKNTTT